MDKDSQNYRQLKLFAILATLGLIAGYIHVPIPYTGVLIEGRWAFGFIGFALLTHRWAAVLLATFLSIPFWGDVAFLTGWPGNLLYALPSLLLIRALHPRMLKRWGPDWRYGLGWGLLVLFCYQAFTTPAVWAIIIVHIENFPLWPHILDGWRTQPFLIESVLVALFSGLAMTAVLAYQQLRMHQRRLTHINRVLRGIRNVNQLIVAEDDPLRLIERACANLTETMGYHNAWITLLDASQSVTATAAAGFDGGFTALQQRLSAGEYPNPDKPEPKRFFAARFLARCARIWAVRH